MVKTFLQKLFLSLNLFIKNELPNHAGAAAFFFLLSIVPVFIIILLLFDRYLTFYPEFSDNFFELLSSFNENLNKDLFTEMGLLNVKGVALGIIGILSLFWSTRYILMSIQRGIGIIFPAEKSRTPLMMNIISFLVLPIILLLIIAVVFISIGLDVFINIPADNQSAGGFLNTLFFLAGKFIPFIITFLVIFLVYRFAPVERPKILPAASGALLCTLGIVVLQFIFSQVISVARYNFIYGILGSVILALVSIQFIFLLFFLFAEFTYVSDKFDVLMMERMYHFYQKRGEGGNKLGKFLFSRPETLFNKYARQYKTGEFLVKTGDGGKEIFFIFKGRIGIYKDKEGNKTQISTINEGEIFGEMAYLLNEKRTATAIAETETILLVFSPAIFEELIRVNRTISKDVIQVLCDRLKESHDTVIL